MPLGTGVVAIGKQGWVRRLTGQAAIAHYLLERGAHLDIFAAAMLGRLDIVQAISAVQPNALTALGPHGIPLIIHAEKGGEAATAVVEFIKANL